MITSQVLTSATSAKRKLPANLIPKDLPLFSHELHKDIPGAELHDLGRATVTEGGYVFVGLQMAPQTFPGGRHAGRRHTLKGYAQRLPSLLPNSAETALWITDLLSAEYFHWLTEALTKLEAASAAGLTGPVVIPGRCYERPYVAQSLHAYPQFTPLVTRRWTSAKVRNLQVVTPTAPMGNYNESIIRAVGTRLRAYFAACSGSGRRIYVSRTKAPRRRISNEALILGTLQRFGFEQVFLEDMAFGDQVKLLAETSHLVSNHGAGLTNMMFMAPGSRVLEIRQRNDRHNNCYFSLASAMQHDYAYLLGDAAETQPDVYDADLILDVHNFNDALSNFMRW